MKIIITGSLGNIGKPLTKDLVQKNHTVTVISNNAERKKEIEDLGATAAIGSIEDVSFLSDTFKNADAVFLVEAIAMSSMFDANFDIVKAYTDIASNYKQAVENSGIKNVVHLSSIGAHTTKGNGLMRMHYYSEQILNELSDAVSITFMRPVGFYANLYRSMDTIKTQGAIISNYGGDKAEPWVSPNDIASAVVEEMENPSTGRKIRYVASEEISPNKIASVLGEAIGKPDLKWIAIPDEQLLQGMVSVGMNKEIAKGFIEMQAAQGSGTMYEDYYKHEPTLGKTKFEEFAKEFAKDYKK